MAPPRQRLRAVRTLTDAGIACGVALAPVLPGITDDPRQLAAVLAAAREAGATHTWSNLLNLRAGTREHFLEVLAREWPEELERYRRLYPATGSGYLPRREADRLGARVAAVRRGAGIADRRRIRLMPDPDPVQLPLAM